MFLGLLFRTEKSYAYYNFPLCIGHPIPPPPPSATHCAQCTTRKTGGKAEEKRRKKGKTNKISQTTGKVKKSVIAI